MKHLHQLFLLLALIGGLSACGKQEEATPSASAPATPAATTPTQTATPAAAPVATAPVAAVSSGLPAECESYLKRAAACYEKAASANPAAVEQMKQSLDQVRAQWDGMPDKSQLGAACKMSDDQFAQTAAALQCE